MHLEITESSNIASLLLPHNGNIRVSHLDLYLNVTVIDGVAIASTGEIYASAAQQAATDDGTFCVATPSGN